MRDQEGRDLIQECLNSPDPPGSIFNPGAAAQASDVNTSAAHKRAASSSALLQENRKDYINNTKTPTIDSRVASPTPSGGPSSPRERGTKRRRTTSSAASAAAESSAAVVPAAHGGDQGGRLIKRPGGQSSGASSSGSGSAGARGNKQVASPVSATFSDPAQNDSLMANMVRIQQQHQQQQQQQQQQPQHQQHQHQQHQQQQQPQHQQHPDIVGHDPSQQPMMHHPALNVAGLSGLPHPGMLNPEEDPNYMQAMQWLQPGQPHPMYDPQTFKHPAHLHQHHQQHPHPQHAAPWGHQPGLPSDFSAPSPQQPWAQ